MSPEDRRKAEVWWARQLEKFPQLQSKYGNDLPIGQDGQVPRNVVSDVQTARQAQTPLVGEGTPLPGQRQIAAPQPVNWRETGRDIVSGISNLASLPFNLIPGLDTQQAGEVATSKMFGVEPRDFDIPEGAGTLRKVIDPLLPTIAGIGTISERFLDPTAAAAWQLGGSALQADPHGQVSARKALREAGYGPLESITGAYEQADIPWYQKLPVEIATSPEELIPGVGLYAGATRLAGRQLGRAVGREAAEETAPVVARETAEEVTPVVEEVEEVIEPVQLGLVPQGTGAQYTLEGTTKFDTPQPSRLAEDVPVSQIQEVPSTAQNRIDEIIENVTDDYDARGMNIIKTGTSPNKLKEPAQEKVRERFGQLITGNLNDAQNKKASEYISKQTGIDAEEIRRLAGDAATEETFGTRLTPDQQMIEDVAAQIDSAYDRVTQFSPEIESQIDNLIGFRQEGKHQLLGFKSHYGRIRNQVAKAVDMTPAELDKHIDNISQGTFPQPDPFPGGVPSPGWKTHQLVGDPQRQKEIDRFAVQLPLPLGRTGSKTQVVEENLARAKNQGYPMPIVSGGSEIGQELEKILNRQYEQITDMETSLREIITPDQQAHILDKNAGVVLEDILSTGEAKTAVGRQLVTRYEGAVNARMNDMQQLAVDGDRLLENIGIGARERGRYFSTERSFVINKEADWGTREAPGPLRFLFRALHGEVVGQPWSEASSALSKRMWITGEGLPTSVLAHPAMAPEKAVQREEIFEFLRRGTDLEEAMRIDFDPKMGFIKKDYFQRGWKPVEELGEDSIRNNMSDLASKMSFQKARTAASYTELENIGLEPLHINPMHMMIHSQQMGIKHRLQIELVNFLQDETIGIAKRVTNQTTALDDLKTKTGMTWRVPDVGPAFQGKGHGTIKVGDGAVTPQIDEVIREGMYAVPSPVADTIENIFRGGSTNWNKTLNVTIPMIDKTYPVNISKLVDAMVFIPKRIKLFASLFQVTDFTRRLGVGSTHAIVDDVFRNIERGLSPKEAFESGVEVGGGYKSHVGAMGKGWAKMWGDYFKAGKSEHYRTLLRSTATVGDEAVIEGGGRQGLINWNNLVRNGLNVRDLTILPTEDVTRMVTSISSNANLPLKVGRYIKELEYSSRRGLFDRVYPAAIMTDVKYNLIPMAMKAYPNATDEQIMGLVARQANMKYSTLLRSQSRVGQTWREILSRVAFSLNENESLIRQISNAFVGTDARFWRTYWVSATAFFAITANTIHAATTLVTEGKPEPLPTDRYIPWYQKDGIVPIGYNNRLFAPDVPITTRSGERALMDMLGQLDTAGRMLQPIDFITQRQSASLGALRHLYEGTDFYGRDTDKHGHVGRVLQFAYDIGVPIGMGEAGVGMVREAVGDVELPAMGKFIAPDTQLKDVLPVSEQELGIGGMIAEATGENIKAPSTVDIEKRMIRNTFPDSDANRIRDLDSDKRLVVQNDPKNALMVEDMSLRSEEKAAMDNIWHKQKVERDDVKAGRMAAEDKLVNDYDKANADGKSFEPSRFRRRLSEIGLEHRVRQDMISKKYGENLDMRLSQKEWREMSQDKQDEMKAKTPIAWAEYRYYMLLNKHSEAFKKMDYKAFETEFDAERAEWGTELAERFDAVRSLKSAEQHNPRVQSYYNAMDLLERVGWFENPRLQEMVRQYSERMPKRKDGTGLIDDWNEWKEGSSEQRRRIERNSYYSTTIKILKKERDRGRQEILMNPQHGIAVDRAVIEWFGRNPTHQENLPLYIGLYKVQPRRMSIAS
jgi:hypothetical protein